MSFEVFRLSVKQKGDKMEQSHVLYDNAGGGTVLRFPFPCINKAIQTEVIRLFNYPQTPYFLMSNTVNLVQKIRIANFYAEG